MEFDEILEDFNRRMNDLAERKQITKGKFISDSIMDYPQFSFLKKYKSTD